jgi:chromosome segregation ATPase
MNRFLTVLNFLGVITLAVLCGFQWRTNSRLEHNVQALEKTRQEEVAKIADQAQAIKEDAADLEDLRQRLSLAETELTETQAKLRLRDAEYGQLQLTLKKWIQAVADRDAALKQAGEQMQKIAADRNAAIQKFNDLANQYNALAKKMGSN